LHDADSIVQAFMAQGDRDLLPETESEVDDDAPTAHRASSSRPPAALPSSPPSADSGLDTGSRGSLGHLATPRDVMLDQEVARTRVFLRLAIGLAVVSGLSLFLVGGDPGVKMVLLGSLAAVLLSCGWLLGKMRDARGYTVGRALFCAFVCIGAVFCGIAFFGVWSPAVAMLPFGLFFFSQGQSTRGIALVYLTCSMGVLVLTGFSSVGLVPDRGLIRADALSDTERLVVMALVQIVLAATFFLARATRQAALEALQRHDRVLRSLGHRDALLKEARQDLAHALRAEGLGQFSDRAVGPWRLGRVLGRGAMGEVYEAVHAQDGRVAAVKLLREHLLGQSVPLQRFFQEARLAAALDVENVVRVIEFSDASASVPYIAMERLEGQDLADQLRAHRRLSPQRLLTMLRQVGKGLDVARAAGVVHRDLKPRNLFCATTAQGEVWKILDFGVSKLLGDEGATLTRDVIGTPAYMAPEQALSLSVTHRTDLFSLGVIAYRALTGRPAFAGDTSAEVLYKVVHTTPAAPGESLRVPAQVDLVFAIAMAKDAEDRFDSGAELAQAFDAAWRGKLSQADVERALRVLRKTPWGSRIQRGTK
jgi:serine/threonine-protein kinase